MRDPFTYLHDASKKYGDVFRIPVPLHDLVVVTHPDLVREVFHDRGATRYGLYDLPKSLEKRVGRGLPMLEGEEYTQRRNLYSPMFGKRFLARLADDFVDEMDRRLQSWDAAAASGTTIDLEREIGKILLPAFMRNMFSMALTDEEIEIYDRDLREILAAVASAFWCRKPPNLMPIPGAPNLVRSSRRMARTINDILDARAGELQRRDDLLQILVEARLPDGSQVDRKARVVDTMGIMMAGYDTVVAVLAWMFSLLPTNPCAQQQLYDEVDALGGVMPSAEHLDRLSWARQCFDETQRIQGHPFNVRWSKTDNELAGFRIPKGTMVGACMTALNRDPRWWAQPDVYDPKHFDKEQVSGRPNTVFIPFGTGPHQCIGMAMAYQNGLLLTALILQRYRIQLKPGWTPRHKMTMSVTIKGGVPCTISRR
ncbi:hypothetical protein BI330_06015 [Mycobacterium sp. CBMA 623]|nr:hypothetical protein [Mycobacteroides sp. CBMA 326]